MLKANVYPYNSTRIDKIDHCSKKSKGKLYSTAVNSMYLRLHFTPTNTEYLVTVQGTTITLGYCSIDSLTPAKRVNNNRLLIPYNMDLVGEYEAEVIDSDTIILTKVN